MDLTLDGEQRLLTGAARAFLARACPLAHVRAMEEDARGFDRTVWREMAALGWPGLALPEAYGGSGRSFLDQTLLVEEMGRVLLPSPYLATTVLAAPLVAEIGTAAQRRRWLPAIAAGETTATLALAEPGWRDEWQEFECRATPDDDVLRLTGEKAFVPFAAHADLVLVAVRGPSLVAIEPSAPGIEVRRQATLGGEPLYALRFAEARGVSLGAAGAAGEALERARRRAAIGALAFMVGAAERVVEMTVEYARTRVQFGRPIGSFQAVAHRCVDMRSDLDALRYLVHQAAWRLARGDAGDVEVGVAKAYGNEALRRLFTHAHQVHGAIGFSTEHALPLFTRRAKATELAWGSAAFHRERVARAMGL